MAPDDTLFIWIALNSWTSLGRHGWCYYPHFTGDETKAQGGAMTCPMPHIWEATELGCSKSMSTTALFPAFRAAVDQKQHPYRHHTLFWALCPLDHAVCSALFHHFARLPQFRPKAADAWSLFMDFVEVYGFFFFLCARLFACPL